MRMHFADPDFRRVPKTKRFCWMCQRDIAHKASIAFVSSVECLCLVHPEDSTQQDGKVLIGPECARKVPKQFLQPE